MQTLLPLPVSFPVERRPRVYRFARIVRGLGARCRVLDAATLLERLHPRELADDPDWPAPTDVPTTTDLLGRLRARQRVLCMATGAALALPLWDDWAVGRTLPGKAATTPAETLAWLERWVDHSASEGDMDAHAWRLADALESFDRALTDADIDPAPGAAHFRKPALAAHQVALTLQHCLGFRALRGDADIVARCIDGLARALAYRRHGWEAATSDKPGAAPVAMQAFLQQWWCHCRCRLAFADAPTASI